MQSDIEVHLHIGGTLFITKRSTLARHESYFTEFTLPLVGDEDVVSRIRVDRDPTHFRWILNFMRGSSALPSDQCVLRELLVEADFYSISELCDAIERELMVRIRANGRVFEVSTDVAKKIGISNPSLLSVHIIDTDPEVLGYIINYLRGAPVVSNRVDFLKRIRFEADSLNLTDIVNRINRAISQCESSDSLFERLLERFPH